jgi:pyruvate/2-oxoglutarate dehydrogenase complex dihydrolipoamide acyltransferase (E2) component
VRAPEAGIVHEILVQEGDTVNSGHSVHLNAQKDGEELKALIILTAFGLTLIILVG